MTGGATTDFDSFVKSQQAAKRKEKPIDWVAERDRWLNDLDELYRKIESFLAKYIESSEITLQYHDHHLNEENIGSYTARKMIVKIGRNEITLTPVGTLLIGARGRVDVMGPAGSTRFMLVNRDAKGFRVKVTIVESKGQIAKEEDHEDIQWEWKLVTNPPAVRFVELTQESLFQAFLEVANG